MLNCHPPSGGHGISLGLVRQYRCAFGAHPSGVGTPTPRSIALGSKKPRLDLLPCGASVRFVFVSVSGLLACSRSHLSAAPFEYVPRLLEPPSALQLPPPAVSISLPLYWYIVANPLARASLGPAFPSEIPARRMASILHMRLSGSGAWVSLASRGCASFVYLIARPILCLLACKSHRACPAHPCAHIRRETRRCSLTSHL